MLCDLAAPGESLPLPWQWAQVQVPLDLWSCKLWTYGLVVVAALMLPETKNRQIATVAANAPTRA